MADFLIEIRNATVYRQDTRALENVDWTLRPEESWAVVGNNGSGKTTLLKLIFGELLPLYGGSVNWFGSREWRGLAEIRRRMGFISPEFQQNYDRNPRAVEVVESGFFSTIGLWEDVKAHQKRAAMEWMRFLGIDRLAEERFHSLSYGERRRVLLARALVNEPALLVLDEPCAGLDIPTREKFLATLARLAKTRTRLVYVTHHVEEILPAITHVLFLKKGRVFAQGPKSRMLRPEAISEALDCPVSLSASEGRYWVTGCRLDQGRPPAIPQASSSPKTRPRQ
ncbi:MAG: ABC transporter ATP-binding protein [Nitrospinaceae bacterium]